MVYLVLLCIEGWMVCWWEKKKQPLGECMHKLQSEGTTVALQLQEPWLREYQVLYTIILYSS